VSELKSILSCLVKYSADLLVQYHANGNGRAYRKLKFGRKEAHDMIWHVTPFRVRKFKDQSHQAA